MIVLSNKQILDIFNQKENKISNNIIYFRQPTHTKKIKNQKGEIKECIVKGHKIQVSGNENLQPIDKLVFFACLTYIQNKGGIATVSSIYRIMYGKIKGDISIRLTTKKAIEDSISRLKGVEIKIISIIGKKEYPSNKTFSLLNYNKTEKGGFLFSKKDNYALRIIIEELKMARTINPEILTPYKNKSIKMLLIEYDFIMRLFYLQKTNDKNNIIQDIKNYCIKYNISQTHKDRIKTFLENVLKHLQDMKFIKYFRFDGDYITIT